MTALAPTPLVNRRVRAFFAPVDRVGTAPVLFDAAQNGAFSMGAPPSPWIDLGWCTKFARKSATKIAPLLTGAPASAATQMRTEIDASVSLEFESWGKLQLALASGSQQMNLLATAAGAASQGSGGTAAAAIALATDGSSTATQLNVGAAASIFAPGNLLAVDVDYTKQTGFVGSGISGGYVRSTAAIGADADYIRRVTLNVGLVVGVTGSLVQLASPLPAGTPTAGMKASLLSGFVDREGGSFFHEWSALFVLDGEQGDRVLFHYPRLQAMQGAAEQQVTLAEPLHIVRLAGAWRALPVKDANDGENVLCFRSYLPGPMRLV